MSIKKIKKNNLLPLFAVIIALTVAIIYINKSDEQFNKVSTVPLLEVNKHIGRLNSDDTQPVITKEVLGFESQYGKLPSSLEGTLLYDKLETGVDGHLIITDDIKYLFDYFLSTINEESIDTILLRVDEYLNHYLQEPALSESKAILTQYITLKSSLVELEQEMGEQVSELGGEQKHGSQYLELLRHRLSQRNALRAQYLDPEVNEQFYQEEEIYDEYTYSRLLINADKSLTPEERGQQLSDIQQMLPNMVRQSMRKSQIIDELKIKTDQIIAEGGDQHQIRQLRKDMFGEEAAQRFDELDRKRAQWKARIDDYLSQRSKIMNNEGLPHDDLKLQVNALRDAHFDSREQLKVVIFERRADA